jgi:hypothetical protein
MTKSKAISPGDSSRRGRGQSRSRPGLTLEDWPEKAYAGVYTADSTNLNYWRNKWQTLEKTRKG